MTTLARLEAGNDYDEQELDQGGRHQCLVIVVTPRKPLRVIPEEQQQHHIVATENNEGGGHFSCRLHHSDMVEADRKHCLVC